MTPALVGCQSWEVQYPDIFINGDNDIKLQLKILKDDVNLNTNFGYNDNDLIPLPKYTEYFDKNGIEKETLSTSWISKDTEPRVDQHLKMETKLDGKGNIIEETEIRIEIINEKTREYKENGIRKKTVITYEYYE